VIEADADIGECEATYVAVTPRGRGDGKTGRREGGKVPPGGPPTRSRDRGRARDRMLAAAGDITHGVQLPRVSWRREKTAEEAAAPDITETATGGARSFWRDGPAPAADLFAYTRSGAWLRGKRNEPLEWAGRMWGYGVALPLTLILGALIWCTHRFHRALVLVIVASVLWVSAPAWLVSGESAPAPVPQIGATP